MRPALSACRPSSPDHADYLALKARGLSHTRASLTIARKLARRQTGCRALMRLYGMGELTSLITLCELGDVGRLSASRKAVRMAGIDIGVHRSDRRARVGQLNRPGSPQLRWALYEAALSACRASSPDHADYLALKARGLSHTRASLTIARKLARRSFHVLRELGPAALDPVTTT
jgi:transposase